jgi:hypothetical protein
MAADEKTGRALPVMGTAHPARGCGGEASKTNYSTRGGAQYIFNMTWTLFNGDWWLWLQAPTRAAGSATTPTGSSTAGS